MKEGIRDYKQMLLDINKIVEKNIDLMEDVSYRTLFHKEGEITKEQIKSMATILSDIYMIAHGVSCSCGDRFNSPVSTVFNSVCKQILIAFNDKYFNDTTPDNIDQLWCVHGEYWNAMFKDHYVFSIANMIDALTLQYTYNDLISWYEHNEWGTKKINMKNYLLLR